MNRRRIEISIRAQQLRVMDRDRELHRYPVSTARNGTGQEMGSECTPLGRHHVRLKIGAGCPLSSVFVARRPSGEIWTPQLANAFPDRDWILTRILWLSGDELGCNRGGDRDSLRRLIYIHGTPDPEPMGEPRSHGCVRMRNADIAVLFDQVERGTRVDILVGDFGTPC